MLTGEIKTLMSVIINMAFVIVDREGITVSVNAADWVLVSTSIF